MFEGISLKNTRMVRVPVPQSFLKRCLKVEKFRKIHGCVFSLSLHFLVHFPTRKSAAFSDVSFVSTRKWRKFTAENLWCSKDAVISHWTSPKLLVVVTAVSMDSGKRGSKLDAMDFSLEFHSHAQESLIFAKLFESLAQKTLRDLCGWCYKRIRDENGSSNRYESSFVV